MIVVTILGILAVIVTISVLGLLGRGQGESYATDKKTLYTVVSTFYSDGHAYSNDGGWNEADDFVPDVHNYPIGNATNNDALDLYLGEVVDLNGYQVNKVMDANGTETEADDTEADDSDIIAAAIWMGLLTNSPGYGTPGADVAPGDANSPAAGENGPYLNPLPKSCSSKNFFKGTGTYTWIVGSNNKVYGVFREGGSWYAGFNGQYP